MRIKILQRPTVASVDGLRLDLFQPGFLYDVGTTLGMLLLAEQWAEPVINEDPALLVALQETESSVERLEKIPSNLIRERSRYEGRLGIAIDFRRRKRSARSAR